MTALQAPALKDTNTDMDTIMDTMIITDTTKTMLVVITDLTDVTDMDMMITMVLPPMPEATTKAHITTMGQTMIIFYGCGYGYGDHRAKY